MKKLFVSLAVLVLTCSTVISQKSTSEMLNNYVHFSNESTHGLLIVHRLLEIFNKDINKYVDLDGDQVNFYSNKDLPKNIFEDPDDMFFKTASPVAWLKTLETEHNSGSLAQSGTLYLLAKKMSNISRAINNIRFDIENYINSHDLTDKVQLQGVYDLLEKGVKYYDDFFTTQVELENAIAAIPSSGTSTLYQNSLDFHTNTKRVMRALRAKQDIDLPKFISVLKQKYPQIMSDLNARSGIRRVKKIDEKLQGTIDASEAYHLTAVVPKEYKLYKKFYFYHNADIINKVNRYGNGYVTYLNDILIKIDPNATLLFEEPHFYQVIYPEKLKKAEYIESSDDEITVIPDNLREREIISGKHEMVIDKEVFEINLYDHLIQDGDKVSINYNGDWILEDYSLEAKPVKLKLKLNKKGKNYLILHAVSIGRRPPNTMAVSYEFGGEKNKIVMRSDLNASDLIEILYQPEGE